MWYLYILQCADDSFYTGITGNLQNRLQQHQSGRASEYTKERRPVCLLYAEEFDTKSEARQREIEVKKFGVANKKRLIKFGRSNKVRSSDIGF